MTYFGRKILVQSFNEKIDFHGRMVLNLVNVTILHKHRTKMKCSFNPFQTNVAPMEKPGSWFSPANFLKNTCGRVIF